MKDAPVILVVEDDAAIRRGLVDSLTYAGYVPHECERGDEVLPMTQEHAPDLVLLDVLLPGRDGFAVLEELRAVEPTIPIIMLTAKGAESDRVHGLHRGADDYIVKPFSQRELLARIEAVLRRSPERCAGVSAMSLDGRVVDFNRREIVFDDGLRAPLSEREAEILKYLCAHRGRAIDRTELLQRVWGLNPRGITTRTIDMHIARLREKLRDAGTSRPFIITVRSKGYMLSDAIDVGEKPQIHTDSS